MDSADFIFAGGGDMRYVVVLLLAALLGPAVVAAQPPVSYVGVYVDNTYSMWCVSGMPSYQSEIWVYLVLGEGGATAFSFDLALPSNVSLTDLIVGGHDPGPSQCLPPYCPTGITNEFGLCLIPPKFSGAWLAHGTITVTSADQGMVEIIGAAGPSSECYIVRCDGEHETPRVLTNLYVNFAPSAPECSGLATEPVTWGAIKGLYR
jgi:hypothetical protein